MWRRTALSRPLIGPACYEIIAYVGSNLSPCSLPGGVVVAQGTLDPLTLVRIQAGQPGIKYKKKPKTLRRPEAFHFS